MPQSSINNGGNWGSPTSILKDKFARAQKVEGRHLAHHHCVDHNPCLDTRIWTLGALFFSSFYRSSSPKKHVSWALRVLGLGYRQWHNHIISIAWACLRMSLKISLHFVYFLCKYSFIAMVHRPFTLQVILLFTACALAIWSPKLNVGIIKLPTNQSVHCHIHKYVIFFIDHMQPSFLKRFDILWLNLWEVHKYLQQAGKQE